MRDSRVSLTGVLTGYPMLTVARQLNKHLKVQAQRETDEAAKSQIKAMAALTRATHNAIAEIIRAQAEGISPPTDPTNAAMQDMEGNPESDGGFALSDDEVDALLISINAHASVSTLSPITDSELRALLTGATT